MGIDERELMLALADGWRIRAVAAEYTAVGGGSYHWVVRDAEGERRFVTVDDKVRVRSFAADEELAAARYPTYNAYQPQLTAEGRHLGVAGEIVSGGVDSVELVLGGELDHLEQGYAFGSAPDGIVQ